MKCGKSMVGTLLMVLCSVVAQGQMDVVPAPEVTDFSSGVYYRLPQTVFYLDVQVRKTTFKAGEYSRYAEKLLGLADVEHVDRVSYRIERAEVRSVSKPDLKETYLVTNLNPKLPLPQLSLTDEGLLLGVNRSGVENVRSELPELPKNQVVKPSVQGGQSLLGEDYMLAGSTSKMADIVAKMIYSTRESRQDLLSGTMEQTPRDGESIKFLSTKLDDQECMLTALFVGSGQEELVWHRFELFIPMKSSKEILFRFSQHLGVVDRDDLAGEPVYLLSSLKKGLEPSHKELSEKEIRSVRNSKSFLDKRGITYLLPSQLTLSVEWKGGKMSEQQFPATQYATKAFLPAILFGNSKEETRVLLSPLLGTVVEMETVAVSKK